MCHWKFKSLLVDILFHEKVNHPVQAPPFENESYVSMSISSMLDRSDQKMLMPPDLNMGVFETNTQQTAAPFPLHIYGLTDHQENNLHHVWKLTYFHVHISYYITYKTKKQQKSNFLVYFTTPPHARYMREKRNQGYLSIMPNICFRTSWARLRVRIWTKFS